MIQILHIADKLAVGDSTIHGVTRLFTWWAPRYDTGKFHIMFCSLRQRDSAAEYLESMGYEVFCLGRGKFSPLTLFDLVRLAREKKVDILHLHGYGATTFGRLAGVMTHVPCIVHEHMFDAGIPVYQRFADYLLARFTTRAIAVSESVKDFLVHYRGLPADGVQVVYNGAPLEAYDEADNSDLEKATGWRKKLAIPESHKVVTIVGRLNVIKGHTYFLKAAREVLSKYSQVTFLVVGDGELMQELQQQTRNLGIDGSVVFMGYCQDVPALLKEMDIKVIASLSEGVPLTLFEAMAAGCAIVATDVGGLGEVIENGRTGLLVPSQDAKALADKILMLLMDDPFCKTMAANAKERSGLYDIRNTVRQLEECYEDILTDAGLFAKKA